MIFTFIWLILLLAIWPVVWFFLRMLIGIVRIGLLMLALCFAYYLVTNG